MPSLPRTSRARGTVGLPPRGNASRGGSPRCTISRNPARHGARQGTRSTRMRRRRTRSGVGGRAGAVSGRRRARCTTAQRKRGRAPLAECASEYPEYPEYPDGPLRRTDDRSGVPLFGRTHGVLSQGTECPTLGYSGYSDGVSCAWTRVGSTRDGTVSGNTPVLACLKPSTPRGTRSTHTGVLGGPRGTRSTHTGSLEDPHGGTLDPHREHAKPPTRAL